eukprot:jgi/Ulvmu1/11488/UM077_0037.1
MLGDIGDGGAITAASGLVPRIFDDLLSQMASRSAAAAAAADDDDDTARAGGGAGQVGTFSYDCHVSMLEIYNETITDLLAPENTNLQIREDAVQGVHVENLSKYRVHAVADVLGLLEQGTKNRHIGETRMNRESSRSHCVLVATLRADRRAGGVRATRTSRLNLVDLAGSEQQKASGAVGERLREASNINKSLSILGRVINSLAQQSKGARAGLHVPYRDSKLTFLLQDSLGGNSRTVMIANVSPCTTNITETQSTLRFAQRAKRMGNKATVNENTAGDPEAMKREIARLKRELAEARVMADGGTWPGTPQDGMCTPLLLPGGGPAAAAGGTPGAASPHNTAVTELVHAVERAQQAENLLHAYKQKNEALESQCSAYEQEKLKRKMMEKFRDTEVARLNKIVHSGKVVGAEMLISDVIEKLRAKVALCEAQRDGHKAEIHTANARVQELRTRLLDARNRRDPDRTALLEQVHNLQNLLLVLKAPAGGAGSVGSDDSLSVDGLLGGLDAPGADNAMSRGAEMLCLQKTRDAELIEAEKARHEEQVQGVRDAHSRELVGLKAELDQQRLRERERQDDSSRVHDELLAVRGELAQARAESERTYHEQLLPTQKELRKVTEEMAELRGRVAELEAQVGDLTAALTREAGAKVNIQEELSRVGEALEVSMASAEDLRRQCEEQALALDEHEGRAEWLTNVQREMREVNRRNKELETRNADLEWDATRAEELRQSQVISTSAGPATPADANGGRDAAPAKLEAQQQAEHVVDVLRTEVQALTIQLQQAQTEAAASREAASKQLDSVQAALRAAEIERDDLHVQYLDAMKQTEALLEDKLQLQTSLGSAESLLHTERQSVSDMRAQLQLAKPPPAEAEGADVEAHMLRDQLEAVTAERDQLTHEVAMVRETIRHNRLKSAEAARSSRASDVPADSIAGQFHAHTERIRELQIDLEVLENERNQAVSELEEERERHAQQAMNLRKEIMAVQQSLADDKERTVMRLKNDYERQLGVSEAKLKEVRSAVRHSNKAAAQHESMVAHLRKQLAAQSAEASDPSQVKEIKAEQESCLRDYVQLAGSVLQLAAWTCGDGGDSAGSLPALRASGVSAASDENRDSQNRGPAAAASGGLMSPRSAALALQKGPAGEALGHAGQWTNVSAMLRRSGKQPTLEELAAGHSQLRSTVSDLLTWLNASNVGM